MYALHVYMCVCVCVCVLRWGCLQLYVCIYEVECLQAGKMSKFQFVMRQISSGVVKSVTGLVCPRHVTSCSGVEGERRVLKGLSTCAKTWSIHNTEGHSLTNTHTHTHTHTQRKREREREAEQERLLGWSRAVEKLQPRWPKMYRPKIRNKWIMSASRRVSPSRFFLKSEMRRGILVLGLKTKLDTWFNLSYGVGMLVGMWEAARSRGGSDGHSPPCTGQ